MATKTFTFGFQRAQTLGALASIAFVWIITVYLVFEAIERIKSPVPINGKIMFFIALFGVAVNIMYYQFFKPVFKHFIDWHILLSMMAMLTIAMATRMSTWMKKKVNKAYTLIRIHHPSLR